MLSFCLFNQWVSGPNFVGFRPAKNIPSEDFDLEAWQRTSGDFISYVNMSVNACAVFNLVRREGFESYRFGMGFVFLLLLRIRYEGSEIYSTLSNPSRKALKCLAPRTN